MFVTKKTPEVIIKEKNLSQVSNVEEISIIIDKILKNNSEKVLEYKKGKTKLFGFFVGQIMKLTKGKANPKIVNDLLKDKIKN